MWGEVFLSLYLFIYLSSSFLFPFCLFLCFFLLRVVREKGGKGEKKEGMFTCCMLSVARHGTICTIGHFCSTFCVQQGRRKMAILCCYSLSPPPLHLVRGVNKQKPITQTHSLPRCTQRAVKRQVKLLRTLELLVDCKKKKRRTVSVCPCEHSAICFIRIPP